MTLRGTRVLIVAVTLAIVTSFAALMAWRAHVWNTDGVTGLVYNPPLQKNVQPLNIGMFKPRPRRVVAVLPGLGAERAGVRIDDEVIAVNGIPMENQPALKQLATGTKVGNFIRYHVRRGDRDLTIPVRVMSPLKSGRLVFASATSIAVAVAFLTISLLVYWMRAESRRARVFYAACVTASLFFLTGVIVSMDMVGRGITTVEQDIARFATVWGLYLALSTVMVTLLLHLALVFPRDHRLLSRYPRAAGAMYIAPFTLPLAIVATGLIADQRKRLGLPFWLLIALTAGAALVPFSRLVYATLKRRRWSTLMEMPYTTAGALMLAAPLLLSLLRVTQSAAAKIVAILFIIVGVIGWPLVLTLAYMVLTCVVLYQSYRTADVEEKRQVRWPLWGTLLAVGVLAVGRIAFFVVLNLNPQIGSNPTYTTVYSVITQLAYLLIPVSFAFAILKYRLMEIDLLIKKTVVYATLTAFVVVAYLVLVGGVGTLLVQSTGVKNQTVTVVSTLAIAALLIPVRNRLQHVVERKLFRRKYDFTAALTTIGQDINSSREPEELLRRIAETTQQALQSRSVAIFVKEPGEPFAPSATIGLPDEVAEKMRLNWPGEMLAALPPAFEPAVLPDTESAKLRRLNAAYVVQARGANEQQTVALLVAGKKLGGEAFDAEDDEFLRSVAGQIAEALKIRSSKKELQEARQAREIQRALLPTQIPQVPGFDISGMSEAARAVGGDYYDVIELGDGKLAFCIADVCGKGMTAALLMSGLQGAVRSLSAPETGPAELVTRVRRVVCRNLSAGKFVTFFYAVLDPTERTIRYTNAGHNPPIVVRANGDVERLREGGPIVGRLFADTTLKEGKLDVRPGDRVVLFTDGVSEARDESEEEFGEDALAELIRSSRTESATDLEDVIVTAVTTYTGNNFHDDVTLLVVAAH